MIKWNSAKEVRALERKREKNWGNLLQGSGCTVKEARPGVTSGQKLNNREMAVSGKSKERF